MRTSLFFLLLPLSSPSTQASAAPLPVLCAEDPAPVPDGRPEVEKLITTLKGHVDKKGAEDRDAVAVLDQLNQEFKASGPKDKAAIVGALGKLFDLRRPDDKAGVPNNGLFLAAATMLGYMAPESTKTLIAAIDNKNLKKQIAVRATLIRSLGKTQDAKEALGTLIQLLQDKDAPVVAAAGEALGEFNASDQATRKKAFEALLKVVTSAKDAKDADMNNTTARDRYDAIVAAFVSSLQKLSKCEERDPDKLRDWWNKNKTKNWDDEK